MLSLARGLEQIAKDLAKLAGTTIYHGMPADETPAALGAVGRHVVGAWARQAKGRALWLVGDRPFKVQTVLHPRERQLFHTNDALGGGA